MNFHSDDTFVEELVVRRNSIVNLLIMMGMILGGILVISGVCT